jgi:hypothetical protein
MLIHASVGHSLDCRVSIGGRQIRVKMNPTSQIRRAACQPVASGQRPSGTA